jgi:hypothetical protein
MNVLDAAIYTTLQGGTALTSQLSGTTAIYHLQAPDNASLPYVVFSQSSGGDENMTPHRTKDVYYFVRAYSATSAANAGSIFAAADARLHLVSMTVSGWTNFWTAQQQDIESVHMDGSGRAVYASGGIYRIRMDKS